MQNIVNKISLNKVINIKSEILFREAEDDFYYFNHLNTAMKKLKQAVFLTPNHLKSIMLYADICFIKGYFKKALYLYSKAEELKHNDFKILASIANCYDALKEYENSVLYTNMAINNDDGKNPELLSQLVEIKIKNLINLKRYKEAYTAFIQSKSILDLTALKQIYSYDYEVINEKIKIQQKLHYSGLKIV